MIEAIKQKMIEQHADVIRNTPDARRRIRHARQQYQAVGMYRVIAAEMATMLGRLAEIVKEVCEGKPELEHIPGVLEDWRQKADYAAQSSMKSVSRQLFEKLLAEFQRPCMVVTMEDGEPEPEEVFIIDALYLKKLSALELFLQPALGDNARRVVEALSAEQAEAVFTLIKGATSGQYYPACMIKRVDARLPGMNVYESFMAALPMIMDQVYNAVLQEVETGPPPVIEGGPGKGYESD
jgi:hypothetical protein